MQQQEEEEEQEREEEEEKEEEGFRISSRHGAPYPSFPSIPAYTSTVTLACNVKVKIDQYMIYQHKVYCIIIKR